jgi:hypothetical protein
MLIQVEAAAIPQSAHRHTEAHYHGHHASYGYGTFSAAVC